MSLEAYSLNQLRDYSSLFSRSSALEWLKGDFSSIYNKINRYDKRWLSSDKHCYLDYLKYVYRILDRHYQNEYVLKNSFLNESLIAELGKDDTKLFNEFRVGNAIADLVMFNGVSKVFEIKTELDTDKRLNSQLAHYRKLFNEIYLIVPASKIEMYDDYDSDVGIITFNNHNNTSQKFESIKPATKQLEIDLASLMDILHTEEYKEIVSDFYGYLPQMTSFNQFVICKQYIERIPNSVLNSYFINKMKTRGTVNTMSNRYFKELNQLKLALKMNKKTQEFFIESLKSPLKAN